MSNISIVHWYADLEKHKCGYCKCDDGSVAYGMWAERLTVEDYQTLINRGWRRSGMYCYKPVMDETCCPLYTIRCDSLNFQPSKSQKKVIKKLNKFLNQDHKSTPEAKCLNSEMDVDDNSTDCNEKIIMKERPNIKFDMISLDELGSVESRKLEIQKEQTKDDKRGALNSPVTPSSSNDSCKDKDSKDVKMNFKKGEGADPNKPPCKKAKLLRLQKKAQKVLQKDKEKPLQPSTGKTLEQLLNDIPVDSKHKLTFKLVSSNKLETELEHDRYEEFKIYKKYQTIIHNDPPEKCNMMGFTRFLISSPLKTRVKGNNSLVTCGSFHQQYWLDDKLIAVAVLDILPQCVSSVYFFYDPDYRFLTLGTYGSLREIYLTQTLYKNMPSIRYYYMGYYVHSCPKMRYKGKLNNSFLLCPETYKWFPIEKCIEKLEKEKYSRFNDDLDALDEDMCTANNVDNIKVYCRSRITTFRSYKQVFNEQDTFDNIGKLIGKKCASELLFVISS